jgi:two-component system cell cycle response regulator
VLKAVMDALSRNIRDEVDWIARYGGEEFVIVLPETPPEGMMVAAERFRQLISSLRIKHDGGELGITASFGAVNHMPLQQTPAVTSMELVNLADRCMYNSKQTGRNKVTGTRC